SESLENEASCASMMMLHRADVAELADALGSGLSSRKGVEVQVLSSAPALVLYTNFYLVDSFRFTAFCLLCERMVAVLRGASFLFGACFLFEIRRISTLRSKAAAILFSIDSDWPK